MLKWFKHKDVGEVSIGNGTHVIEVPTKHANPYQVFISTQSDTYNVCHAELDFFSVIVMAQSFIIHAKVVNDAVTVNYEVRY